MYMNYDKYVEHCVNRLSVEIGARPAGSQANRRAADFIAGGMKQAGYQVVEQKYPCPDWQAVSGELTVVGKKVPIVINTFSPSCDMEAELVPVTSVEELQNLDLTGRIAVVHGEITGTSFMPKNFDRRIYVDENKDRFIELLEKGRPAAVITVSHNDIPLPVIEDSELDIPSVTVYRDAGKYVVESVGKKARLKIVTRRRAGTGSNVIGRWGQGEKKILLCAHYDTKPGTPGAMDNASGVAALLLLAWQLRKLKTKVSVELVAFGGEDSWFPGDALYIQGFPPDDLAAAINIDGVGAKNASTMMAIFGCSDELTARISETAKEYGDFVQGLFYESDHGFFWPLGIPTLAFTSMCSNELLGRVIHTKNDTIDLLDTRKIEQTAGLVLEIVQMLTSSKDN